MHANMLHERYILYYKYVFSYAVLYFLQLRTVLFSAHTFLFALRSTGVCECNGNGSASSIVITTR